jgi:hypothetical protein
LGTSLFISSIIIWLPPVVKCARKWAEASTLVQTSRSRIALGRVNVDLVNAGLLDSLQGIHQQTLAYALPPVSLHYLDFDDMGVFIDPGIEPGILSHEPIEETGILSLYLGHD